MVELLGVVLVCTDKFFSLVILKLDLKVLIVIWILINSLCEIQ